MSRFSDTPRSLNDACLVLISEIHRDCRIFTLERNFKHYRRFGMPVIPVLIPWRFDRGQVTQSNLMQSPLELVLP